MSTPWYGHRFVLQHNPIPRSNGGMRIVIEFDTGENHDVWGLADYEPLLHLLEKARRDAVDIGFRIAPAQPDAASKEIDLGDFEIAHEFHGEPMRDEAVAR